MTVSSGSTRGSTQIFVPIANWPVIVSYPGLAEADAVQRVAGHFAGARERVGQGFRAGELLATSGAPAMPVTGICACSW